MSGRYFVEPPIAADQATLSGQEAHHLLHVMRARAGDEVTLFDGSGAEFSARITVLERQRVQLAVLDRQEVSREPSLAMTIGVALPKGDRQKWLVEKLTEIGVARLVPLKAARGVAQPESGALDRLRRSVIEASKQCGRNRLMEIAAPQDWTEFVDGAPQNGLRLLADPAGVPLRQSSVTASTADSAWAAIGPEGGITENEVSAARAAGWQTVKLGPSILRIETAAIWITAVLQIFHEPQT